MKILIRNLDRDITQDALAAMFKPFGAMESCDLILDKATGLSKGFGFVVMLNDKEAQYAVKKLNGQRVGRMKIRVKKTLRGEPHVPYQSKDKGKDNRA